MGTQRERLTRAARKDGAADAVASDPRPAAASSLPELSNLDIQRELKARARGADGGDAAQIQRVASELGDGQPLASSLGAIGGGAVPDVRVHSDATAARLAADASASAFTVGRDVVLGADAPRPGTLAGDALLAHEVAHVQQQVAGTGGSGSATAAAGERDANLAGARLVAERLGLVAPIARQPVGARLSLQRCDSKKDKAEDAGALAKDAGVAPGDAGADAGTPDAGTPPGPSSGLSSSLVAATTSGKVHFDTVEKAAAQFGGNLNAIAPLIARYAKQVDPKFDPNAIGPRTKFDVPSAIEVPESAEMPSDDVDQPSSSAYQTWVAEDDPRKPGKDGVKRSLLASVPSKDSGVTIGRGYDMKERKPQEIEDELVAAGVDPTVAKKYRGAAGKSGKHAREWIKKNKPAALTADQEKLLFRQEYQAITNNVVATRLATSEIGEGGYKVEGTELKLDIDLAHLNPTILAFVVDLRFRGDLKDKTWAHIKDAVRANDLAALQAIVADIPQHKKFFYNNWERYKSRCQLVGVPYEEKSTFDAR